MKTKNWLVTVVRTEYSSREFKIQALTQSEAEEKALEEALGEDFSGSGNAEYEVEDSVRL